MLRRILLYLSVAGWAQRFATRNWLARRVARRFVAGETLEESVTVAKALNKEGFRVTFTYLGERRSTAKRKPAKSSPNTSASLNSSPKKT